MNFKELIKKNLIAVLAFTLVIGFSAFKAVEKSLEDTYYWFEYDEDGEELLNQENAPVLSPDNPFGCSTGDQNCAQAFTSYNMVTPNDFEPGTPASQNGQPIIVHRESQ